MAVTVLPAFLTRNQGEACPEKGDISLFGYATATPGDKSMITLEQNLFSFITEGEKKVWAGGDTSAITQGGYILLAGGNCLMTEKLSSSGHYSSLLLFFDASLLQDFMARHIPAHMTKSRAHEKPSFTPEKPSLASEKPAGPGSTGKPHPTTSFGTTSPPPPFIPLRKDPFIDHYTGSLQQILASELRKSRPMLILKLEELFLYLSDAYPGMLEDFIRREKTGEEERIIRQVVESSLDRQITLEELAFLCNTSLSTFKRRFMRIYGDSPNKWILRRKMDIAAQLLRAGKERPGEVYYKIGYKNLSSFTQAFKQIHGISPRDFRSQNASLQLQSPSSLSQNPSSVLANVSAAPAGMLDVSQ